MQGSQHGSNQTIHGSVPVVGCLNGLSSTQVFHHGSSVATSVPDQVEKGKTPMMQPAERLETTVWFYPRQNYTVETETRMDKGFHGYRLKEKVVAERV